VSGALLAAGVLAKSGEAVKSGPIGLAVILVLCVVCYFLFKSMSKHLRTVRERFPGEQPPQPPSAQQRTAAPQPPVDLVKHDADPPGAEPPAG
jgi:hypothetical protein